MSRPGATTLNIDWLNFADSTQYSLILRPYTAIPDRVHLVFAPTVSHATIDALVDRLPQSQQLGFFDGKFPGAPADPGAYVDLIHRDGSYHLSARNHGWSTGWRAVSAQLAAQYLWRCRNSNMRTEECVSLTPASGQMARIDNDPDSALARRLMERS